jgi:hypothetical protein
VANAKWDIKHITMDLNAPIDLVWATLKNIVGMEGDLLLLQNTWRCLLMMKTATLVGLNQLCGAKNNIFSKTKIPKCKNLIVAPEVDISKKEIVEEGIATQGKFGNEMSVAKSKILTHFLKGKISFSPLETILTILGELEYLEGIIKLAKKQKD